mgnify:CR=1 FL=1
MKGPSRSSVLEGAIQNSPEKVKSLNVIFNYNGHSWDAYEVLGLPAGSSFETVKRAYESTLNSFEGESREFVDLAYQAIEKHLKS